MPKQHTIETNTEMSIATSSTTNIETSKPTPSTSSNTKDRLFTKVFLENFDLSNLHWDIGHWHEKVKTNICIGGNSYGRCVTPELPNYGRLFFKCNITLSEAEIAKLGKLPKFKDMADIRSISAKEKLEYEDHISKLESSLRKLKRKLIKTSRGAYVSGNELTDAKYQQLLDMDKLEDDIADCKDDLDNYTKILYLSKLPSEVPDLFEDLCKVFILGLLYRTIEKPLHYEFYKILEFSEILIKKLGNCSKTYKKKKFRFSIDNWESPDCLDKLRQLTEEQVIIHERLVNWMSEDL